VEVLSRTDPTGYDESPDDQAQQDDGVVRPGNQPD
jgi:hypothetical protein